MEHLDRTERVRALAAAFAAVVLFASAFVGIRYVVTAQTLSPGHLVLARMIVASLCLGVIALVAGGVRLPQGRDWLAFLALGGCGQTLYHTLLNYGELTVDSGTAALLVSTAPILASVAAVALLGERLTALGWIGTAIAFVGAAMIAASAGVSLHLGSGVLLILIATVLWAGYQIVQKAVAGRYGPLELTAWPAWIATVLLLVPFGPGLIPEVAATDAGTIAAVVWLGAGSSVGGFLAWSYAIKRVPVVVSSNALFGVPVAAFVIGLIVLGEVPTLGALVGGVVVIAGVALLQTRGRPALADAAHQGPEPASGVAEVLEPA